jgi:hypothetical protein
MRFTFDKLILAIINSEMFIVANIYQPVISSPNHQSEYNSILTKSKKKTLFPEPPPLIRSGSTSEIPSE